MAYAEDLKFSGVKTPCGFESRPRHTFRYARDREPRAHARFRVILREMFRRHRIAEPQDHFLTLRRRPRPLDE